MKSVREIREEILSEMNLQRVNPAYKYVALKNGEVKEFTTREEASNYSKLIERIQTNEQEVKAYRDAEMQATSDALDKYQHNQQSAFFEFFPRLTVEDYKMALGFANSNYHMGDDDHDTLLNHIGEFLDLNKDQIVKNTIRTQEFEKGL